ncbi:MAG: hypothetical protein ACI8Y4_005097 [Candidatus Poriferisodalaceae bacterium]|jgi:hypothetical protein
MSLAEQVISVDTALTTAGLPHAFGGALALGYCTADPRGTADIDVCVFVAEHIDEILSALTPLGVTCEPSQRKRLNDIGEGRAMLSRTPIDIFTSVSDFHSEVEGRVVRRNFAGVQIPFVRCSDLAVFKAMFDRTKDWADIEAMIDAATIDPDAVAEQLESLLGEDSRADRLRNLPKS